MKYDPFDTGVLTTEERDRMVLYLGQDRLDWIEFNGRACGACMGLGIRSYSSTATWRSGCGGQAITPGVCDQCWGSGSADRPWPSHRMLEASHG